MDCKQHIEYWDCLHPEQLKLAVVRVLHINPDSAAVTICHREQACFPTKRFAFCSIIKHQHHIPQQC
jgi:hypothetical protein